MKRLSFPPAPVPHPPPPSHYCYLYMYVFRFKKMLVCITWEYINILKTSTHTNLIQTDLYCAQLQWEKEKN